MHYTCLFNLCCALWCWACHSVMFLEMARELSTMGRRRTWRYWLMTIWFDKHINRSYLIMLRGSRNDYWMMIASLIMQQDIPIMRSSMLLPDLQSVLMISHNCSAVVTETKLFLIFGVTISPPSWRFFQILLKSFLGQWVWTPPQPPLASPPP